MSYSKSWGHLGKPPKSVLDGSSPKMEQYKRYQQEVAEAAKLTNSKNRASKIALIRARYLRDFPPEE